MDITFRIRFLTVYWYKNHNIKQLVTLYKKLYINLANYYYYILSLKLQVNEILSIYRFSFCYHMTFILKSCLYIFYLIFML